MGWDKDCWKDTAKVANTNKAFSCHAVLAVPVPSAQQGPAQTPQGQGLCPGDLAALCATQSSAQPVCVILLQGFTGAAGTGLSWKGLAGAISRQGSYSKIFLAWVTATSLGLLESLMQRRLSMTQPTPRELQCLSPFTHLWVAKSFLKLLFCSPLL